MHFYRILYLSLFIIVPYLIIQTEFISEYNLFLTKLFHTEFNIHIFRLLLSFHFIFYIITFILGFGEVFLCEIFAGIFTIYSSIMFYKPFSDERKKFVHYIPHLDILYVFFIGELIFVHGLIIVV